MGGVIHHTIAAIICAAAVYYYFKNKEYSAAVFIGNYLPDAIGGVYAAVIINSINPNSVLKSEAWLSDERGIVTQLMWMTMQITFILTFLFFRKYIRKKEFKEFEYNLGFLLIGFIVHMIMDIFIIEQGVWY